MEETITQNQLIANFSTYVAETDPGKLRAACDQLLEDCDYQVLNFTEHFFTPQGYTALWLLGESHLAIHTFPENGTTYLELSSCNAAKNEKFKKLLEDMF
jgi:S-adenosylmethionine/arginine decarboxylase-like enzyme